MYLYRIARDPLSLVVKDAVATMYSLVIVLVLTPLIHANCNNTSEWFNENNPSDPASNGNDIERFALIRAKYPWKFDISRWTGEFEIRPAANQSVTDNSTALISKYARISDGLICHAVNKLRCMDFEVGWADDRCGYSHLYSSSPYAIRFDSVWNTTRVVYQRILL